MITTGFQEVTFNAQLCHEWSWFVIDASMNDSWIVSGLMHCKLILFLHESKGQVWVPGKQRTLGQIIWIMWYYGVPNTRTCTFIYFFLKIKGVFSYTGMYVYSFFPKSTGVRWFGYVRLIIFLSKVQVYNFGMYGYFFWQKVQVHLTIFSFCTDLIDTRKMSRDFPGFYMFQGICNAFQGFPMLSRGLWVFFGQGVSPPQKNVNVLVISVCIWTWPHTSNLSKCLGQPLSQLPLTLELWPYYWGGSVI